MTTIAPIISFTLVRIHNKSRMGLVVVDQVFQLIESKFSVSTWCSWSSTRKTSLHHHSFRKLSLQTKAHQLSNIRSSSDGVQRHFEENQSIINDQHSNVCSQPNISNSIMSFDTSSITSAYFPTSHDETNNSIDSLTMRTKDLLFNNHESNDETFSSDSNDSNININTESSNYNGHDLININGNGNGANNEIDHRKKFDRKKLDDKKRHIGLFRGIRAKNKKTS